MIDLHYTPVDLARAMLRAVPPDFTPTSVADFSAGEGALLIEAEKIWKGVSVHANDISRQSATSLTRRNPGWAVSCSDFLSPGSHSYTKYASKVRCIDLILLNPPFSERGRSPTNWPSHRQIKTGLATAFVHLALRYLADDGLMVAILPDGSLSSVRDKQGWDLIKKEYLVEVIQSNPTNAFKNATARTSIVTIVRKKRSIEQDPAASHTDEGEAPTPSLMVHRGVVQMHSVRPSDGGYPLIHTSNLKSGAVSSFPSVTLTTGITITGPAILFPRVGRTTPDKVCLLKRGQTVILSDCVLALSCKSLAAARKIKQVIVNDWEGFAGLYRGTGAPYTTVARASVFLEGVLARL